MRTIRVLFLKAASNDHWLNKAVSLIDPPFCHVEVELENPSSAGLLSAAPPLASSIYADETVFLRQRTFANPNYTILTFEVDDRAFNRMLAFARRATDEKVGFDSIAMIASYIPLCCYPRSDRHTFCSEYITRLLQTGGLPEATRLNARRTTPSRLYRALSTARRQCFSSVPYKLTLLTQQEDIAF